MCSVIVSVLYGNIYINACLYLILIVALRVVVLVYRRKRSAATIDIWEEAKGGTTHQYSTLL